MGLTNNVIYSPVASRLQPRRASTDQFAHAQNHAQGEQGLLLASLGELWIYHPLKLGNRNYGKLLMQVLLQSPTVVETDV